MQRRDVLSSWIILAILTGAAMMLTAMSLLLKQPFGICMCKQLCQRLSRCHTISYNTCTLSCHIGVMQDGNHDIRKLTLVLKSNVKWIENCPLEHISLTNKVKQLQCIKYGRRRIDVHKSARKVLDYFKMSAELFKACQNLHSFCEIGKKKEAMSCLAQLNKHREDHTDLQPFSSHFSKYPCKLLRNIRRNNTILHIAVQYGYIDVVRCCLSKHRLNVNQVGWKKNTPIMQASLYGFKNIVVLLLKSGSTLANVNDNGETVLHTACIGGGLAIVKDIVREESVNIDSRTHDGLTALMTAVASGKEDIFHYLLDSGCNGTLADFQGRNVLHIASAHGKLSLVKYIIAEDVVDKESRDNLGKTALMHAAFGGRKNVFAFLLNNHCNFSVVDGAGNNIIHWACRKCYLFVVMTMHKHRHDSLLKMKNKKGQTPIDMIKKNECSILHEFFVL